MRWLAIVGLVAVLCGCAERPVPAAIDASAAPVAKVYVVRHFQKAAGEDPPLTAEGSANAERLADLLEDKGIAAIFATPTRRAMETAAPLGRRLGIAVTPYDPRDPQALAAAVAALSGPALVVGHSNTVPDLVALFGGERPEPISEQEYGTLFIVGADGSVSRVEIR